MIENIKAGERMTQAVLLRLQKVGNSSNGGVFARGTEEDNSGKIQFIAFERDIVNRLRDLDAAKAFMISGPVDIVKYSSTLALQVVIQKLDNIMPEDDISNLVPTGSFDMEVYKNKLEALINGVKTPSLRTLLKKVFSGPFYEEFCKNPAGMKLHHAYLGGLLQAIRRRPFGKRLWKCKQQCPLLCGFYPCRGTPRKNVQQHQQWLAHRFLGTHGTESRLPDLLHPPDFKFRSRKGRRYRRKNRYRVLVQFRGKYRRKQQRNE